MDFVEAGKLARTLIAQHAPTYKFAWNSRKRCLGICRYGPKQIELSRHWVIAHPEEEVRDTILHEIAHAIAGHKAGHGTQWKRVCRQIGARPVRLYVGKYKI